MLKVRARTMLRGCGFLLISLVAAAQSQTGSVTVAFPETHNLVTLALPGKTAALQMDLHDMKVTEKQLTPDGARIRILARNSRGFIFSAFLTPAQSPGDSRQFREWVWKDLQKAQRNPQQMRTWEAGPMALREYIVEEFQGKRIHQKSVFGYLVSGDQWMDIHISKGGFTEADQPFLDSILRSIQMLKDYRPDSGGYFEYGSFFYMHKNWARAADFYQQGLELEKQQRRLDRTYWRVLVDNLGMSYGLSGRMPEAKAVLEYGVSQEPTYPMFHYNLACVHAEMNELDGAIAELNTAFGYRKNQNPGEEGMPDPLQDDSFKRYLRDPKFRAAVAALPRN